MIYIPSGAHPPAPQRLKAGHTPSLAMRRCPNTLEALPIPISDVSQFITYHDAGTERIPLKELQN